MQSIVDLYLQEYRKDPEIIQVNTTAQEWQNKPKCPTCGSTNIKKISATSKVIGAATLGLFSNTARSQFECHNCGYKW